jgi:hypothetical protein
MQAVGFLIGNTLITILIAYAILAIFHFGQLWQYKNSGLAIAAVVTSLLTFTITASQGQTAVTWTGWAVGMVFIAWRVSRKPKAKADGQEAGRSPLD